ncbi:MAG TPA: hypothetical protein VHM93_14810 [Candidatus Acidoferrum sp.]|nr:hypothetical protein [Candidatus Acidoferrum sp.]
MDSKGMFGPRPLSVLSLGTVFLSCCAATDPLCAQTNGIVQQESNTIRGTVLNKVTHEPIARALVFSQDNRFATLTDDRGHFEFVFAGGEGQPAGGATVQNFATNRPSLLLARKPGFLPTDSEPPMLQAGGTEQELTIPLEPEALVVGHVFLPGSDAFDRIQVELFRRQVREGREHWDSAGTVWSRSDGEFRFVELPAGSYKLVTHELLDRDPLTFNPSGQLYGYPPVYYPSAAGFAAASIIRLSAGSTFRASVSLERRAYYPVRMRVANAPTGMSIGISVWPLASQGPGYSLSYNATEQLILGALPEGTYLVRAMVYGPEAMTGVSTLTVKGSAVGGPVMTMLPNGSIPVTVQEEFQNPESSTEGSMSGGGIRSGSGTERRRNYLNVSLIPLEEFGPTPGAFLRSPKGPDDDSPLVIENVQPGRYRVAVNTTIGYASSITSGGTNLLRQPLVVGEGSTTAPIEITVRDDGAEVEGKIERTPAGSVDKTGFTSPGTSQGNVYFVPTADSTGQFRVAWLSTDGTFQLHQLPPGVYQIFAFDRQQPDLEYASEEAMAKYEPKSQVIRVVAGQKVRLQLPLITERE